MAGDAQTRGVKSRWVEEEENEAITTIFRVAPSEGLKGDFGLFHPWESKNLQHPPPPPFFFFFFWDFSIVDYHFFIIIHLGSWTQSNPTIAPSWQISQSCLSF